MPRDRIEKLLSNNNLNGKSARAVRTSGIAAKLATYFSIRIACTHGLFSSDSLQRLQNQDDVSEIVCTNTVPIPAAKRVPKLRVLSIAPALAEAIRRIHNGESVSALFDAR